MVHYLRECLNLTFIHPKRDFRGNFTSSPSCLWNKMYVKFTGKTLWGDEKN